MTHEEVVKKISMECAVALGELNHLNTIYYYVNMAVCVGRDHFTNDMDEVVALDHLGKEQGVFKSTQEAADKLGLNRQNITAVLNGRKHSAGGYLFMKRKDFTSSLIK